MNSVFRALVLFTCLGLSSCIRYQGCDAKQSPADTGSSDIGSAFTICGIRTGEKLADLRLSNGQILDRIDSAGVYRLFDSKTNSKVYLVTRKDEIWEVRADANASLERAGKAELKFGDGLFAVERLFTQTVEKPGIIVVIDGDQIVEVCTSQKVDAFRLIRRTRSVTPKASP